MGKRQEGRLMPVGAGTVQEIEAELREVFGGPVGTFPQMVAYLGCADSGLRKLLQAREIPAFKFGSHWRFRAAAIAKWIHAQESLEWTA